MAQRGRPPKPVEVHRRNGNPSRKDLPVPAVVLDPIDVIPPPPDELGEIGAAAWPVIWRTAGPWLSRDLDAPQVQMVCAAYDEIDSLRRQVQAAGHVVHVPLVTPKGPAIDPATGDGMTKPMANPAVQMMRDAEKQLQSWLSDLGFSPTARARLGIAEVKRQSKIEELIARRASRER